MHEALLASAKPQTTSRWHRVVRLRRGGQPATMKGQGLGFRVWLGSFPLTVTATTRGNRSSNGPFSDSSWVGE